MIQLALCRNWIVSHRTLYITCNPDTDTRYCPVLYLHWLEMDCTVFMHYGDVIMGAISSQITSLTIVYSTVYSDADQRKHQSSASLAFVRGAVNSPHKWPVTRKMFLFDDVIMAGFVLYIGRRYKDDIAQYRLSITGIKQYHFCIDFFNV